MIYIFWAIICACCVVVDRLTKIWALDCLAQIKTKTFIKGFMDFTFVENRGAAFGILQGKKLFFVVLTAVIGIFIIYYFLKIPKEKKHMRLRLSLTLILAGAIGNVFDRIAYGYVVDFFDFAFFDFPVFNVADICVVIGTFLLGYVMLFVYKGDACAG